LQGKFTGEKLKGWSNSREKNKLKTTIKISQHQLRNHNSLTNWQTSRILVATKRNC